VVRVLLGGQLGEKSNAKGKREKRSKKSIDNFPVKERTGVTKGVTLNRTAYRGEPGRKVKNGHEKNGQGDGELLRKRGDK